MNKLPIEAATYLLEGLTKFSAEEFRKPFNVMIQKERVKQLGSIVSMGLYSLSTSVNIKSVIKLDNTSYHYLCTSVAFNVTTASFNPCFSCDATNHGVCSFPHRKDQKKIVGNKNKFIDMKKSKMEM